VCIFSLRLRLWNLHPQLSKSGAVVVLIQLYLPLMVGESQYTEGSLNSSCIYGDGRKLVGQSQLPVLQWSKSSFSR